MREALPPWISEVPVRRAVGWAFGKRRRRRSREASQYEVER